MMPNESMHADLFAVFARLAASEPGREVSALPHRPAASSKPTARQPRLEIAHVALRPRYEDRPSRAVP
jgi:hypothetical protein